MSGAMRRAPVTILLLATLGCTTEFQADDGATDPDVTADTTVDTGADTAADTTTDPGVDTGADPVVDTTGDPPLDTAADPGLDTGVDGVTDPGLDIPTTCSIEGFEAATQMAQRTVDLMMLQANSTNTYPTDILWITLYYSFGDPPPLTGPGTFELGVSALEQNLATCGTCIFIARQCPASSLDCAGFYHALSGILEIETYDAVGGIIQGRLLDAVFPEITFDPSTWESAMIEGGETWCLPEFAFEATLSGG